MKYLQQEFHHKIVVFLTEQYYLFMVICLNCPVVGHYVMVQMEHQTYGGVS